MAIAIFEDNRSGGLPWSSFIAAAPALAQAYVLFLHRQGGLGQIADASRIRYEAAMQSGWGAPTSWTAPQTDTDWYPVARPLSETVVARTSFQPETSPAQVTSSAETLEEPRGLSPTTKRRYEHTEGPYSPHSFFDSPHSRRLKRWHFFLEEQKQKDDAWYADRCSESGILSPTRSSDSPRTKKLKGRWFLEHFPCFGTYVVTFKSSGMQGGGFQTPNPKPLTLKPRPETTASEGFGPG